MRSDGLELYLNCAYSSGLSVVEEYRKFHRFTLEFYASDPYFYGATKEERIYVPITNRLTLNNNLIIGNYHKMGEYTGEGSGTIINLSSTVINPIIRLRNPKGDITISNLTTGKQIVFNNFGDWNLLYYGGYLVIDTRENHKGIFIELDNGDIYTANQYLNWSNVDFYFPIIQGANNITFSVGTGSKTEYVQFDLAERYLSV